MIHPGEEPASSRTWNVLIMLARLNREAIANHLGERDSANEYDSENRKYLPHIFFQHAFLLNAIKSEPECQELVEKVNLDVSARSSN